MVVGENEANLEGDAALPEERPLAGLTRPGREGSALSSSTVDVPESQLPLRNFWLGGPFIVTTTKWGRASRRFSLGEPLTFEQAAESVSLLSAQR
jgi:hypothetical protein